MSSFEELAKLTEAERARDARRHAARWFDIPAGSTWPPVRVLHDIFRTHLGSRWHNRRAPASSTR